jgi:hypothetical protein
MKLVLLYSENIDPVTDVILRKANHLPCELVAIPIQDLMGPTRIFDVVEDGKASLSWTLPCGKLVTNSDDTYLINRVLGVSETLFEDFLPSDRNYVLAEFIAYLAFAIEAFPMKSSSPGHLGLCGNQYPLPAQWEMVKRSASSLRVPSYYYGDPESCPWISPNAARVFSDVYNFYQWQPNEQPVHEKASLVFLRPRGIPVLGFQCNGIATFKRFDSLEIESSHKTLLTAAAAAMQVTFGYFIAEMLFFVDDDQVTFGMISPMVLQAPQMRDFEKTVLDGVVKFVKGAR